MQEFDLDVFDIMSAAGVYLLHHLPMAVFRDGYLPTVHELVGTQRLADRHEQMYELFARTLASKVRTGFLLCYYTSIIATGVGGGRWLGSKTLGHRLPAWLLSPNNSG